MQEYLDSGVRLGWWLNPQDQQAEVYRLGQAKQGYDLPVELSGEDVLPRFVLPIEWFVVD